MLDAHFYAGIRVTVPVTSIFFGFPKKEPRIINGNIEIGLKYKRNKEPRATTPQTIVAFVLLSVALFTNANLRLIALSF